MDLDTKKVNKFSQTGSEYFKDLNKKNHAQTEALKDMEIEDQLGSLSTEVTNKIMWVPAHKKCDQVKDCPNSMDECNLDCDLHNIASPKSLIKSYALSDSPIYFEILSLI